VVHFLKTLFGCLFVWHLKGTSDLTGGDVIITHTGGEITDGWPGKINDYLERVVRKLHDETGLPIIAQRELAQLITDLPLVGNIPRQSESPAYLDTIDVCKIHKKVCEENGWKHPILVSYQPHLWRGMMVARKLGIGVIVPEIKSGVYDKECGQRWMTTPWLNTPRELACRLLWLFQGKI
jgi:hypothetical protein